MNDHPVQLDALRTWLKSKPPTLVVGKAGDDCACPVAEYLNERWPSDVVWWTVCTSSVSADVAYENPTWLAYFIQAIDDQEGAQSHICAATALRILNEVAPA